MKRAAGGAGVEEVLELLRARAGLVFSDARREVALAGVFRAMEAAGVADASVYARLLRRSGRAVEALLAEVTVGETYFFRDAAQWAVVRERAIADILARRGPGHTLRAWSAACSTGEEPYTLAIVCEELGVARRIVGTDLSEPRLKAARAARYGRWALRDVPAETVARWFRRRGDAWELAPAARRGVELRRMNLVDEAWPGIGEMDLVLCRNVLIYLERDAVAAVARRLLGALADGGWLFLGPSDPPVSDFAPCEVVVTPAGLAYRKTAGARSLVSFGEGRSAVHVPAPKPAAAPPAIPVSPPAGGAPAGGAAPFAHRPAVEVPSPETVPSAEAVARAYAARDYGRVAALARARAEAGEDDAATAALRVRALANRGELAEAEAACGAALERHRESAPLHYLRALLLSRAGRPAEAAAGARQAAYLDPEMAVAHLLLATELLRLGQREGGRRALRAAERVLEAMPPGAAVAESDGETAAHLLRSARARLALLREGAA
ncbi:MAG TPA: protein-glutamate O-methyltransferase CheR [Longimicrobium sp.]|nr:protein-glutamate O-methyltransferase CheR [Longimicrobium sp.]